MRLAFVAPSTAHPSGGVAVVYEMAAAMARRGHDVDLYHVNFLEGSVSSIDEIGWLVTPGHDLPDWITFVQRPPVKQLVHDIYNSSRVFLCTSNVEGFGLTNVEAMACGAALVTTDNGGSRDYAEHGRTALVAPDGDAGALADHVVSLLGDDDRRVALASAGRDHVLRFDWDRTGALLDAFLDRYVADPARYGYGLRAAAT